MTGWWLGQLEGVDPSCRRKKTRIQRPKKTKRQCDSSNVLAVGSWHWHHCVVPSDRKWKKKQKKNTTCSNEHSSTLLFCERKKKISHSEGNWSEREVQGSGISFDGGIEIYPPSSYLELFKAKNPVGNPQVSGGGWLGCNHVIDDFPLQELGGLRVCFHVRSPRLKHHKKTDVD